MSLPSLCDYADLFRFSEDAANDAYSGLLVYKRLLSIAEKQQRTLDPCLYTSDISFEDSVKADMLAQISAQNSERMSSIGSTVSNSSDDANRTAAELPQPMADLRIGPRPQHLRAYRMWHEQDLSLATICAKLRSTQNPLKESTVMYALLVFICPVVLGLTHLWLLCLVPT
jgi:hypothetical protein